MSEPIKGLKKAFNDAAERGETRCSVCLSAVHSKEYHENDHYDNVQPPISTTVGVIPCSTHTETAKPIPGMSAYIPEPQPQATSAGALKLEDVQPTMSEAENLVETLQLIASGDAAPRTLAQSALEKWNVVLRADKSEYICPKCRKAVPENAPCPYCKPLRAASGGALSAEPWLFAIAEPSGAWHDGEQCVFGDRESAQNEVDMLNDDLPEGEEQYKLVPLFRTLAAHDQKVRHDAMNNMLRIVVASLKEYPNGGGDIQIVGGVKQNLAYLKGTIRV